jgi:5-methylcytosine-specific restriction endonuclease McrA
MDRRVLILNADYSPIMVSTVQRAFILMYLNKTELVEKANGYKIRSVNAQFPMPAVIKLNNYVNVPYKKVPMTRQNIFKRDEFECQYCGKQENLTLDHLIPKARGGRSTWDNLTTACSRCNAQKGDQTPRESGLKLNSKPIRPSYNSFIKNNSGFVCDEWLPYLDIKR